jgi:hypothetical protein
MTRNDRRRPVRGGAAALLGSEQLSQSSATRFDNQAPREFHDPLADDVVVLWPSQRRPLRRDLARLVARWEGWA